MPLFKKNQRYRVSRKYDFIQVVTLLDGSHMECNLSAESLPSDCLENVLQRLEVREVALFGLKYFTPAGQMRWADFNVPLKRQLEKHASSQILCIGIFYYIDRAYALQDESTRYQFYLQLKADVLDGRLYCTLEQAILLSGYALQAEYQNYDDARQSEEYIKEIERLDNTLLPRSLVAEYDSRTALADIAQHIVSSHMTLSGMSSSQAEIAYIHLAQQMDGCGVEYAKATRADGDEVYLGSSSSGIIVRRQDGHIMQEFSWTQIAELTSNKKSLQINITNRKLSTRFIMGDADSAKYVQRVFQLQQEFFHDKYDHLLYSDDELASQQDNSEPLLSPSRHAAQLSNLSNNVIYNSTRASNREKAVDVIEEEPSTATTSIRDIPEAVTNVEADPSTGATPDLLDTQYENEYATMKVKKDPVPLSERPRAQTASLYAGSSQTPMLDQLHKNDLLHRSMTALQEYRESFERQQQLQQYLATPAAAAAEALLSHSHPRNALLHYASSADHLSSPSHNMVAASMLSRSMHGLELSTHQSGLPSYRPSPDYDMVMKKRTMHAEAYMPEVYHQQQTVRELQSGITAADPRSLFAQYVGSPGSHPDTSSHDMKEPLYANITQQYTGIQHDYHRHIQDGDGQETVNLVVDRDQQPTPYQNHSVSHQHGADLEQQQQQQIDAHNLYYQQYNPEQPPQQYTYHPPPPPPLHPNTGNALEHGPPVYPRLIATPDLMRELYPHAANVGQKQGPDITHLHEPPVAYAPGSPDVISRRHLKDPSPLPHVIAPPPAGQYRSFDNLAQSSYSEERLSVRSQRSSNRSRSSTARGNPSGHDGSQLGSAMSNTSAADNTFGSKPLSLDERVTGLEEKLNTDGIAAEYESLLKKRQPADCRVALRPENDARNRFPNVLPYEDTRVRLIATSTNPHGYINASHVEMTVGSEKLTYIATQNPFVDTVQDFWQTIWVYNVSIVTMVTELEERGTQKCPRYWPSAAGPENAVSVNDLKIVLKHSASAPNFTTSCLRVLKTSTKEQRTIWHIQYTDWHQTGCPKDVHGFLALLDELNSVRLHMQTNKKSESPRMLVHCSTGVGRSGVVILSDVMRKCLENNEKISVASTLKALRQQRMYMVQTLAQYKFVHEVLVHYLKGVRLI